MSKCEVHIVFDNGKRRYQIGDTVSGTVNVEVNAPCRCDNLSIDQQWRTHGRGNRSSGETTSLTLFNGEWKTPGTYTYPFSFKAPPGPLTYHGHYINVDWYLDARADIPWALDPKAREDYVLDRGEYEGDLLHGHPHSDAALKQAVNGVARNSTSANYIGYGCLFLFFFPFLFGGVWGVYDGIAQWKAQKSDWWESFLTGCVFLSLIFTVVAFALRKYLAEKKLGKVECSIKPTTVRGNDDIQCELRMTPRSDLQLNKVTLSLVGREQATSGSGTNQSAHKLDIHRFSETLAQGRAVTSGEYVSFHGDLMVPPNAAPSLIAIDNKIEWSVEVHIDIARWPDWKQTQLLLVQ